MTWGYCSNTFTRVTWIQNKYKTTVRTEMWIYEYDIRLYLWSFHCSGSELCAGTKCDRRSWNWASSDKKHQTAELLLIWLKYEPSVCENTFPLIPAVLLPLPSTLTLWSVTVLENGGLRHRIQLMPSVMTLM